MSLFQILTIFVSHCPPANAGSISQVNINSGQKPIMLSHYIHNVFLCTQKEKLYCIVVTVLIMWSVKMNFNQVGDVTPEEAATLKYPNGFGQQEVPHRQSELWAAIERRVCGSLDELLTPGIQTMNVIHFSVFQICWKKVWCQNKAANSLN